MKLTAITIYHHGINHTFFVKLPVINGKVRISKYFESCLLSWIGCQGDTCCLGGIGY